MIVAIRGAITVDENNADEILESVSLLLKNILEANELLQEEVIAIFFTATKDLDAVYPAKAARMMGFNEISLMCMQEMDVKNSLKNCIRVMVLCERNIEKKVKHIYLGGAKVLRPDLSEEATEYIGGVK